MAVATDSTAWTDAHGSSLITCIPGHAPVESAAWAELFSPKASSQTLWVVGSSVMPLWLQPVPDGVRSLTELASAARAHAHQRLGAIDHGKDWVVQGDWRADRPFVCQALPRTLFSAMGKTPIVSSPFTLGAARLDSKGLRDGWCAITTPFEAHIVYRRRGRHLHLRSWRLSGQASAPLIEQHLVDEWQRERLRTAWPDDTLHWLHLGKTPHKAPGQRNLRWADETLQHALNQSQQSPEEDPPLDEASSHLRAAVRLLNMGALL
ncbi:hypothetical protein KBW71_25295 [Hydrogenophaga aromaticivorans]|uniref:hypothetical protein n=1 Tax=Hydrogenophaga aromaticivorans TaxID=2610898 RepID=UPI001B37363F|nr:hypothetical protein [Hydrogenophaga aromaticivorans]MBQ0921763.1 hypothetical protein [Hydrogenophaga aromaticivorans]